MQKNALIRGKTVSYTHLVRLAPTENQIVITDNGLGIPTAEVEKTLISIGNSKKSSESSRGFRGIGRLAALSYCQRLTFSTSFKGCLLYTSAISSQLAQDAPPEITIDLNDMTSLREKVNQIIHYWRNKRNITIPFSAEQRNRFLTAINKQISMSAAAGALIPIKEKEFSKIDFVQDSILDCLHNYRQAQIVGGAGTGKTFIGIKKAVRDILDGKKVLFICCNEELAAFVKSRLSQYPKIDVFTYAELMRSLLGELYDELPTRCV